MKKLMLVLAMLFVAAPAMAAVTITADCVDHVVTISYATDGNLPRAFALDVTVDNGTIDAIGDLSADFDIYPGSIVIVDGEVNDPGSAVCDSSYPDTLGGLGTAGVTIEMGSLYADGEAAPATSGVLCTLTVSDDAEVTVAANAIRGGIVMEDPTEDPADNLPVTTECGGVCNFDATGDSYLVPDGFINVQDLNLLTGNLTYAKYLVDKYEITKDDPTTGSLFIACFDVTSDTYMVPDNIIDVKDLNVLTGNLTYAKYLYDKYEYECGDPTLDPQ